MEDFVTFEIAKKLKEKGFNEECLAYYTTEYTLYNNVITLTDDKYLCVSDIDYEESLVSHNSIKYTNGNYVDAPTISQALKWLREEKKIYVALDFFRLNGNIEIWWTYSIRYIEDDTTSSEICKQKSYEQAALEGIKHVLDTLI
jgi:hypothetical protein